MARQYPRCFDFRGDIPGIRFSGARFSSPDLSGASAFWPVSGGPLLEPEI